MLICWNEKLNFREADADDVIDQNDVDDENSDSD